MDTNRFSLCLSNSERSALQGSLFRHPLLSTPAKNLAKLIVQEATRNLPYWTRTDCQGFMERHIWNNAEFASLNVREKQYLRSLAQFYQRQMQPSHPRNLQQAPSATMLANQATYTYNSPPTDPSAPETRTCWSPENWNLHSLHVEGLARDIPIYIERSEETDWPQYESNLRRAFDLLKFVVTAEVLNTTLQSSFLGADFSITIGSGRADSHIEDCDGIGSGNHGGMAYYPSNRLVVRSFAGLLGAYNRQSGQGYRGNYLNLFFHEFGHFFDFLFLNHEMRANLLALNHWMRARYQSGEGHANSFIPRNCTFNQDRTPHCLDDSFETFADLFSEYALHAHFGTRLWGTQNISPGSLNQRHLAARLQIMKNLFKPDGLHLEALSLENIARAYQENGIPLTVEELQGHHRSMWTHEFQVSALGNFSPNHPHPLQAGLGGAFQARTTSTTTPNFTAGLFQTGFYPWGGQTLLELGIATPDHPNFRAEAQIFGGVGYGVPIDEAHPLVGTGLQLRYNFTSPTRYAEFGVVAGARWLIDPISHTQMWQTNLGLTLSYRFLSL